jgi:hypothetical protein
MHRILDSFLSDHANVHEADETTRRELKIIELLKSKSLSVAAGEPLRSPPTSRTHELADDADAEGKSRVSAMRTVPVPVPRPRANSTSAALGSRLASPGYHGSDRTLGESSSQSSPAWISGPLGSHARAGHKKFVSSLDEGGEVSTPNGNATLSPIESSSSAQRLLDNWVNSAQIESVGSGTFGLNAGLDPSLGTLGSSANAWLSMDGSSGHEQAYQPAPPRTDSADLLGVVPNGLGDRSAVDWNYWENLIEQIRASGSSG